MRLKPLLLIVIPVTIIAILAVIAFNIYFGQSLLYFDSYILDSIAFSDKAILIEGGFVGSSGIGYEGFDYYIEHENLYLKLYRQSFSAPPPLTGSINIELNGDFSKLEGIYLVQPKGVPINIWSR